MDRRKLLFSVPTLCDPSPAVDASTPPSSYRSLHEDDWRQVEFVAPRNREYIKKELAALEAFKRQHRRGPGWTKVHIRREHPTSLATVGLSFAGMPAFSVSPLVIGSGAPFADTVHGGFALSDVGDWFIYGQHTEDGCILQLAVSPGRSAPSGRFAQALSRLTQASGLILVDWYAASVVDTTSLESVLAWAERYQRS